MFNVFKLFVLESTFCGILDIWVMFMKKMNLLMIVSMIIGTLYYLVFKFNSDRILTYLAIIPVIGAPLV